jgi:hypothetical protein
MASPRLSPVPASEAVGLAAWVSLCQPRSSLVNTYTAPWAKWPLMLAAGAAAAMVVPVGGDGHPASEAVVGGSVASGPRGHTECLILRARDRRR